MENGSRTVYRDPRPARTPSREQQSSFFPDFSTRQKYVPVIYATGSCSVGELCTFRREWPPQLSGTCYHSCAAPFVRQSGKTWRSLICVRCFSVRLLLLHVKSASRHSDRQSRRVPLCVHDYRAFRTGCRQHSRQQPL